VTQRHHAARERRREIAVLRMPPQPGIIQTSRGDGELVHFDSARATAMDHPLASCGLLREFAPVELRWAVAWQRPRPAGLAPRALERGWGRMSRWEVVKLMLLSLVISTGIIGAQVLAWTLVLSQ